MRKARARPTAEQIEQLPSRLLEWAETEQPNRRSGRKRSPAAEIVVREFDAISTAKARGITDGQIVREIASRYRVTMSVRSLHRHLLAAKAARGALDG